MRIVFFLFAICCVSYLNRRFVPRDLLIARSRCAPTWDMAAIRLCQIAIIGLGILFPDETPAYLIVNGLFLYVAGQTMIVLAARENPYFLPTIQAPPVVIRTGIYRHLRHPGYLGHFISMSGAWLIWSSLYALVPLVIFACILFWRARKENALLEVEEWKTVSLSFLSQ